MGPDYDNKRYPDIKAVSVEEYMRSMKMEALGRASFPWENKTRGREV